MSYLKKDINCKQYYFEKHAGTLRALLEEQSILSKQGSIFLENQLSEQAELSKQGGVLLQRSLAILRNNAFLP